LLKKVATKALKFGYEIFLGAFAQIVTERHEVSHYFKILKGLAFMYMSLKNTYRDPQSEVSKLILHLLEFLH